ncbi:MAG: tetratricopeptide repeat protein [Planctomycetota bacterium]|jgi:hypothetical protein
MPIISKCPRCHEQVTIPDGLDPGAEVRCPLCVVVYPLRDVLAEVPPALIPVDSGVIEGPGPDSDDACGPPETDAESAADEPRTLDAWQEVDVGSRDTPASDHASPAIDTGQTPVDTDALAAFDIRESEEKQEPVSGSPSKAPRKRKKQKGPVRLMAEVFLGGFGGLLIGYYVLCWTLWGLGSRRDIPKLPLPLLPPEMHSFEGAKEPAGSPRQPSSEDDRGVTYLQDGEFDKAIAEFTKEIQLDPASATTYGNRAGAYVAKGEFDKAIVDYTEAIRLDPQLAGAYYGRGVAYDCSGEPDKAIVDYDEAIRLNPRYAEAYHSRGEAYEKKGEKSKAEADFAKAKALGYQPERSLGRSMTREC